MMFEQLRLVFEWLRDATKEKMRRFAAKLTIADLLRLDAWFELWAHESQLPPKAEGWRVWLMRAGRGFGKTRAGAEWVHGLASSRPGARIALVGATIADARSIMVEGVSGLLNIAKLHGRAEPGPPEVAERERGAIVLGRQCRWIAGPGTRFCVGR